MEYDPKTDLRHHPTSMARFGQNPYGENLYRIVFAPSRRYLICSERAHWVKLYPDSGDIWIMERWLSASEYHPLGRANWDQTCSVLGPWPERGEYQLCHEFWAAAPEQCDIGKLIMWSEAGRKQRPIENQIAIRNQYENEQKSQHEEAYARIGNALPAFGASAMAGYGGGRGTKTNPTEMSAQDAGLPVFKPSEKKGKNLSRHNLVSI